MVCWSNHTLGPGCLEQVLRFSVDLGEGVSGPKAQKSQKVSKKGPKSQKNSENVFWGGVSKSEGMGPKTPKRKSQKRPEKSKKSEDVFFGKCKQIRGYLRKKGLSCVSCICQVLLGPSAKWRKRQKRGEKGQFPGK